MSKWSNKMLWGIKYISWVFLTKLNVCTLINVFTYVQLDNFLPDPLLMSRPPCQLPWAPFWWAWTRGQLGCHHYSPWRVICIVIIIIVLIIILVLLFLFLFLFLPLHFTANHFFVECDMAVEIWKELQKYMELKLLIRVWKLFYTFLPYLNLVSEELVSWY